MGDGRVACPECAWAAAGEPWEIAKAAAAARPKGDAQAAAGKPRGLPTWRLSELLNYEPDSTEEIWPGGILSKGERTAIVGAPGVGKSRLALQAAISTILGWSFLGWQTNGVGLKWYFYQTENSARRLKADLHAMTRHLRQTLRDEIEEHLGILKLESLDFASIVMTDGHPDRVRIIESLEDEKPNVAVIDPLRDAGTGDPNKDADMTATCQGIGSVIRHGDPRRVPLLIHHGRTGATEVSRVFGDDAASFGRNSKVLYGWLRSQINVAPAGVEHEDVVIVGCGKCSNGPKWEPFAARLNRDTMLYRRLERAEFNLDEWCEKMGGVSAKKKKALPTPDEVAEIVEKAGGQMRGGVHADGGLVATVSATWRVSRKDAQDAVTMALGETIETVEKPRENGRQPPRIYILKEGRKYEK